MMLNVKKKEDELVVPDFKAKVSKKSKFKIKWKTIQWLMDHKEGFLLNMISCILIEIDAINHLCNNYDFLIKFIKERVF